MYKKIENNVPTGNLYVESNLRGILPAGTVFTSEGLAPLGYCIFNTVRTNPEQFDLTKEYLEIAPVQNAQGSWDQQWVLTDKVFETEEAKAEAERSTESNAWWRLRVTRDHYLSRTDFYGYSDRVMPTSIVEYRQELRDVPANTLDPLQVVWPTPPIEGLQS
jgi:hypothetical protein